jgi:transcriptional regulator with XRE-family HTH domain
MEKSNPITQRDRTMRSSSLTAVTPAGALFGEHLRKLRTQRGLTQVELAEITGIPQNHISTIERGAKLLTLGTLIRFAAALDCKVSTLVRLFDKEDLGLLLPK